MPRRYQMLYENTNPGGAITVLQLKAGANSLCRIIRVWANQGANTTSANGRIQLLRKSAAATVTSYTPLLLDPGDGAAKSVGGTSATGIAASAEGTDGNILIGEGFNWLSGYLYVPVPEERIIVPPAGIFAVKFPLAPGMAINAGLIFEEEGG